MQLGDFGVFSRDTVLLLWVLVAKSNILESNSISGVNTFGYCVSCCNKVKVNHPMVGWLCAAIRNLWGWAHFQRCCFLFLLDPGVNTWLLYWVSFLTAKKGCNKHIFPCNVWLHCLTVPLWLWTCSDLDFSFISRLAGFAGLFFLMFPLQKAFTSQPSCLHRGAAICQLSMLHKWLLAAVVLQLCK